MQEVILKILDGALAAAEPAQRDGFAACEDLVAQIEQLAALLSLHALSAPHSVHASDATSEHVPARHGEHSGEPLPAYVPASQTVWFWPSHANPAGHVVHVPFAFGTVPA